MSQDEAEEASGKLCEGRQGLCPWSRSEIVVKGLWNSIIAVKVTLAVAITVTFEVAIKLCIVVIRGLSDGRERECVHK